MFNDYLKIDKRIEFLNEIGLNGNGLRKRIENGRIVYKTGNLDAYKIREDCINDFLEFCDDNLEKKRYKIKYARDIVDGEFPSDRVYKQIESFHPQVKKYRKEDIHTLENSENLDEKIDILKRLTLKDLVITMYGLAQKKNEEFKQTLRNYESLIDKFRPEIYDENPEKNYRAILSSDADEMYDSAKKLKTCNGSDSDLWEFKKYLDFWKFRAWSRDNGTLFFVTKDEENNIHGYTRSFLVEDEKNKVHLGIDTIEIMRDKGKNVMEKYDAENHKDILKAETLACIQFGLDVGVNDIFLKDSRAKFGLRQTFSNKEKKFKIKKIGNMTPTGTLLKNFNYSHHCSETAYALMENWKPFQTPNI